MEKTIRREGCFSLIETEEGFAWTMMSAAGDCWYWHPAEQQWTSCFFASATPEAATVGLDPNCLQAKKEFHHHMS